MYEGAFKRIPQLEAEKKVLESDMEKIREVSAVIEGKDLDLGTTRSQLEITSMATAQLEVVVRELEEKLKVEKNDGKLFDDLHFKKGRAVGLRVGESLGFEKGYRAAHAAFPHSQDMRNLIEKYRQKIFHKIWHSMLFIQKATPLAQSCLQGAVEHCRRLWMILLRKLGSLLIRLRWLNL